MGCRSRARASNPIRSGWRSFRRKTGTMFFAIMALLTATLAGGIMVYLWNVGELRLEQTNVLTVENQSARQETVALKLQRALDNCAAVKMVAVHSRSRCVG